MKTQSALSFNAILFGLLVLINGTVAQGQTEEMENSKVISKNEIASLNWMACPEPLDVSGCHITILHGDPAKPNTDILFKLEPGASVPRHWHTSAERMVMISGEMEVTYDGEEPQSFKPGTYAYGPSNKPHIARCMENGDPCVIFIAFEEPVDSFVETD